MAGPGDSAGGGLDTGDTADVGRGTDAASGVAAEVEGHASRRHYRRRTTTAAVGTAFKVVGVVGATVNKVVGLAVKSQLGGVGLAQEYCARLPKPLHNRGVLFRHEVGPAEGAAGADNALGVQGVLDGHGDTVERAEGVTAGTGLIGDPGLISCTVGAELDDGVELAVNLFDTG